MSKTKKLSYFIYFLKFKVKVSSFLLLLTCVAHSLKGRLKHIFTGRDGLRYATNTVFIQIPTYPPHSVPLTHTLTPSRGHKHMMYKGVRCTSTCLKIQQSPPTVLMKASESIS